LAKPRSSGAFLFSLLLCLVLLAILYFLYPIDKGCRLFPRIFMLAVMLMALPGLAGCQSTTDPVFEMFRAVYLGGKNPTGEGLDPRFNYLRVTSGQRVAFFALGYVEPHAQGAIEVWYSAERETLRLQNGRVVGLSGTLAEWREVRLPELPAWGELLSREGSYHWTRIRDFMPGYQFNLRDALSLDSVAAPAKSSLSGLDAAGLRWLEERMVSTSAGADFLLPARYAVQWLQGDAVVVYGEQCISADLCLTWQRWKTPP
jgi:hypothetical protein